ncbi:MAG: hypothetical protein CMI26_08685 [Opitutae bacterium]|nr:hypothetical protein [Opitutae bacterium]
MCRRQRKTKTMHRQYPDPHAQGSSIRRSSDTGFGQGGGSAANDLWEASSSFLLDSGLCMGFATSVAYMCALLFTASQLAELATWLAAPLGGTSGRKREARGGV